MKLKQIGSNMTEVRYENGVIIFVSYETPVAAFSPKSGYFVTDKYYSRTTSKHITKWLAGVTNFQKVSPDFLNGMMDCETA